MFENKSGEKFSLITCPIWASKKVGRLAELLQHLGFYLVDVQLKCVMVL